MVVRRKKGGGKKARAIGRRNISPPPPTQTPRTPPRQKKKNPHPTPTPPPQKKTPKTPKKHIPNPPQPPQPPPPLQGKIQALRFSGGERAFAKKGGTSLWGEGKSSSKGWRCLKRIRERESRCRQAIWVGFPAAPPCPFGGERQGA